MPDNSTPPLDPYQSVSALPVPAQPNPPPVPTRPPADLDMTNEAPADVRKVHPRSKLRLKGGPTDWELLLLSDGRAFSSAIAYLTLLLGGVLLTGWCADRLASHSQLSSAPHVWLVVLSAVVVLAGGGWFVLKLEKTKKKTKKTKKKKRKK